MAAPKTPDDDGDRKVVPIKSRAERTTDVGNARRLVTRYGDRVRFVGGARGFWIVWDGTRWTRDATSQVEYFAKKTVRSIFLEAKDAPTADESTKLAAWAMRSESGPRIREMIRLAQSEPEIQIPYTALDPDPWRLNVANGTIDLRTGVLRDHDPEHLITKLTPIEYLPDAEAPRWHAFLARVMAGRSDLLAFLQLAVGYVLTGSTREQVLFLLYGKGANGKSTFLEVIRALLGEYARQASFATFLARRSEGPRNDIADLAGARLVTSVEASEGQRFDEAVVKQLTGSDTISARFLYQEAFEFVPTFKIFLAANHKPRTRATDFAFWRRMRLVPFDVVIPEAERDKGLAQDLLGELPGILSWAVDGCLAWQRDGLPMPAAVAAATEEYRTEQDTIRGFLEECCVRDAQSAVAMKELYEAYKRWAEQAGENRLSQTKLGLLLEEREISGRQTGKTRTIYRYGIRLRGADEAVDAWEGEASNPLRASDAKPSQLNMSLSVERVETHSLTTLHNEEVDIKTSLERPETLSPAQPSHPPPGPGGVPESPSVDDDLEARIEREAMQTEGDEPAYQTPTLRRP